MRWTADELPDLSGRVAVVTGANSGIGRQVARALARHGASVVLAGRDLAALQEAAIDVPGGRVAELDLASIASIRRFAGKWTGPLDLLIDNAGIMAPPRRAQTADGFELQFGTNHLGHYVLTGLLLPALTATAGRVVTVSSVAHLGGGRDVLAGNAEPPYDPRRAYANSKLANLLFARQLQRELTDHDSPVTSVAAHPGVSATGLFSSRQGMGTNPVLRLVVPPVLAVTTQSAAAGARSVLYAATEAEPGSYTGPQRLGETRGPIGPARLSSAARDDDLAPATLAGQRGPDRLPLRLVLDSSGWTKTSFSSSTTGRSTRS